MIMHYVLFLRETHYLLNYFILIIISKKNIVLCDRMFITSIYAIMIFLIMTVKINQTFF